MEYKIVRYSSCEGLEVIVNGMLTVGWKPLGGLIFDDCSNLRYVQPMIREDDIEDNE